MTVLDIVEAAGTATGILCVWLFVRQNIWAWSATVASAILFGVVFLNAELYSSMGLQGFYVVLALYGWRQWRRGGADRAGIRVQHLTGRQATVLGMLVLVTVILLLVVQIYATSGTVATYETLRTFVTGNSATFARCTGNGHELGRNLDAGQENSRKLAAFGL